jgi:xylulokinase
MEGICLASGAAYKWFRDTFGTLEQEAASKVGIDAYEILNAEASSSPAGANGIIIMPSLIGAGTPNWDPRVRGVFLGLTLETDKKNLTRAMLEGICLEMRWALEAAKKLGTEIAEVRIWGGAAKSTLWNQIAADIYGVPVARTELSEGGLVGAAICAGVGIKLFHSAQEGVQAMVRIAERYEPNPKLLPKYDEMFAIYKDAYHALVGAGIFNRIAAL